MVDIPTIEDQGKSPHVRNEFLMTIREMEKLKNWNRNSKFLQLSK